uniref:Uncharacterized protein n=1 Tax=Mucochytrium quahogii TaxID=96639 RepID=A0A7S2RGS5_9STRA|mmetsp:Transcript_36843/g.59687  ORF Transcript_36843/g.59687 Transcript_36843/m.59687 type:complete len:139 (-) Transcript_36843:69-485(-)
MIVKKTIWRILSCADGSVGKNWQVNRKKSRKGHDRLKLDGCVDSLLVWDYPGTFTFASILYTCMHVPRHDLVLLCAHRVSRTNLGPILLAISVIGLVPPHKQQPPPPKIEYSDPIHQYSDPIHWTGSTTQATTTKDRI